MSDKPKPASKSAFQSQRGTPVLSPVDGSGTMFVTVKQEKPPCPQTRVTPTRTITTQNNPRKMRTGTPNQSKASAQNSTNSSSDCLARERPSAPSTPPNSLACLPKTSSKTLYISTNKRPPSSSQFNPISTSTPRSSQQKLPASQVCSANGKRPQSTLGPPPRQCASACTPCPLCGVCPPCPSCPPGPTVKPEPQPAPKKSFQQARPVLSPVESKGGPIPATDATFQSVPRTAPCPTVKPEPQQAPKKSFHQAPQQARPVSTPVESKGCPIPETDATFQSVPRTAPSEKREPEGARKGRLLKIEILSVRDCNQYDVDKITAASKKPIPKYDPCYDIDKMVRLKPEECKTQVTKKPSGKKIKCPETVSECVGIKGDNTVMSQGTANDSTLRDDECNVTRSPPTVSLSYHVPQTAMSPVNEEKKEETMSTSLHFGDQPSVDLGDEYCPIDESKQSEAIPDTCPPVPSEAEVDAVKEEKCDVSEQEKDETSKNENVVVKEEDKDAKAVPRTAPSEKCEPEGARKGHLLKIEILSARDCNQYDVDKNTAASKKQIPEYDPCYDVDKTVPLKPEECKTQVTKKLSGEKIKCPETVSECVGIKGDDTVMSQGTADESTLRDDECDVTRSPPTEPSSCHVSETAMPPVKEGKAEESMSTSLHFGERPSVDLGDEYCPIDESKQSEAVSDTYPSVPSETEVDAVKEGKGLVAKEGYKRAKAKEGYKRAEAKEGYKRAEATEGYKGAEATEGYKRAEAKMGDKGAAEHTVPSDQRETAEETDQDAGATARDGIKGQKATAAKQSPTDQAQEEPADDTRRSISSIFGPTTRDLVRLSSGPLGTLQNVLGPTSTPRPIRPARKKRSGRYYDEPNPPENSRIRSVRTALATTPYGASSSSFAFLLRRRIGRWNKTRNIGAEESSQSESSSIDSE